MEKYLLKFTLVILLVFTIGCGKTENNHDTANEAALVNKESNPNMLSAEEIEAGWELLFDGQVADLWRGYNKPGFPEHGWKVEDGQLIVEKPAKGVQRWW